MQAVLVRAFGPTDQVEVGEIEPPLRLGTEVIVDVHAAGMNPIDWKTVAGKGAAKAVAPLLPWVPGGDVAGVVAEAPYEAHDLQVGDAVYGIANHWRTRGSFAEQVTVPSLALAPKPESLSFELAAAVPCAALGARALLVLDPRIVEAVLGGMFFLMIPDRRWLVARGMRIKAWQLTLVGAGIGFLTGLVASTGPINTPFFLAYGLVKGAFLATEALGSMAIGITKALVFRRFDALPLETVVRGLAVGASLMVGSRLAKAFVLQLDPAQFRLLMDAMLAVAGAVLLWGALAL